MNFIRITNGGQIFTIAADKVTHLVEVGGYTAINIVGQEKGISIKVSSDEILRALEGTLLAIIDGNN